MAWIALLDSSNQLFFYFCNLRKYVCIIIEIVWTETEINFFEIININCFLLVSNCLLKKNGSYFFFTAYWSKILIFSMLAIKKDPIFNVFWKVYLHFNVLKK